MREIVFDTETTGIDAAEGHRIIQIGAVELQHYIPTGRHFMTLINPGRAIDPGAEAVHGISAAMLKDQPRFEEIIEDFLAFIEDSPLVAHNAEFDRKFLNVELAAIERPMMERTRFIDTLEIARSRYPGQKNSLDMLCKRLGVDNSMRERHDALLDCQILAEVYLELRGGRQQGLVLADAAPARSAPSRAAANPFASAARPARPHAPDDAESAAHAAFIIGMKNPIWSR